MISYTHVSEFGGAEGREYVYEGEEFEVYIPISSNLVSVSLDCDLHHHQDLILIVDTVKDLKEWEITKKQTVDWDGDFDEAEDTKAWLTIREGTRDLHDDTLAGDEFDKALEQCSSILLQECETSVQVDEFFAVDVGTPEGCWDVPMLLSTEEDDNMVLAKRVYKHKKKQLEVIRTSTDSATVSLKCEKHDHEDIIVGMMEVGRGWLIGRKKSDEGPRGPIDMFSAAVEHCANMLVEECEAVLQVDEFFAEDERVYEYQGEQFELFRTSPDSATVNLKCGKHDHEGFNVAPGDGVEGWLVGRGNDPYGPSDKETGWRFAEAVEFSADKLVEECEAVVQLDEFFAEGVP